MLCPADQTPLTMSERSGIEIDYCPTCRGVWLDRGELDKILERSAAQPQAAPPPQQQFQQPQQQQYQDAPRGYHKPHHKRRKSFLEDLFD
jgi:Zn-finger nucleic acid-binding protein